MHVGVQPLLSLHGGQQFTLLSERRIIRHHHVLLHHPASLVCPFSWPRPLCTTDTQNKTSEAMRKHQRCHIDKNSLENCSRKLLVQQREYQLWLETIILLRQIIFNISVHFTTLAHNYLIAALRRANSHNCLMTPVLLLAVWMLQSRREMEGKSMSTSSAWLLESD